MGRTLTRGLRVAGLHLSIEAPPALAWEWPDGPLRRFACAPEGADMAIGVRVARPEAPPRSAVAYDSDGGIFDIARDGRDWIVALSVRGALLRVARFDEDFTAGEVVVHPDSFYARDRHYPLAYPLDELLALHRLARQGGLLLHACGVTHRGRAMLFTGPSGAGKTTIARFSLRAQGHRVLSDDRIVIRADGPGFRVWGTPWHGDAPLSSDASAPLAAIHAIHQTPGLRAEPLSGAGAAATVLSNAFVPAHDPVAAERSLELAERIVSRVPVVRLGCPLDPSVVAYAWERAAVPACAA